MVVLKYLAVVFPTFSKNILHWMFTIGTCIKRRLARHPVFYGMSRIWRSLSRVPKTAVTGRDLSCISAVLVPYFKTLDKLFNSHVAISLIKPGMMLSLKA